ncbi:MAG: alpha/beta hydrolase [Planctomycetota bacterium]
MRSKMLKIAITIFIAYLILCAGAFWFQRKLIFLPTRGLIPEPGLLGIAAIKVTIPVSQSVQLCAWWASAGDSPYTLIWCHGNAGNIAHRAEEYQDFVKAGINMVLFDYRGYGESTGTPSANGVMEDALAVYDFLVSQGVKPRHIVPYGRSIGSGPASVLVNEREVAALILVQPITSMLNMGRTAYPFLPVKLLLREKMDNEAELERFKGPLLILHGDQDDIVPYAMGRRLLEVSASEEKSLVTLEGGDHNNIGYTHGRQIVGSVKDWLDRLEQARERK